MAKSRGLPLNLIFVVKSPSLSREKLSRLTLDCGILTTIRCAVGHFNQSKASRHHLLKSIPVTVYRLTLCYSLYRLVGLFSLHSGDLATASC
jgi:hypothetical protein